MVDVCRAREMQELQRTNRRLMEDLQRLREVAASQEVELQLQRAAAAEASQARSRFLDVMSHELRTPLNAIAGYAQLLSMGIHGPVTAAQAEALRRISHGQEHLLQLVENVLGFARIEAGAETFRAEVVELDDLIERIAERVYPRITAAGLALDVNVTAGCKARGDREKLEQIVENLLENARSFTPSGGRVEVSSLTPERAGGVVFLRVADTGIGIPADKCGTVFEPFVQVDMSRTRVVEGAGLGLAISRELARGMGGDLRVRSVEGCGSAFTVTLPCAA